MQIKTKRGVWIFAGSFTLIAMLIAFALIYVLFPPEMLAMNIRQTVIVCGIIGPPMSGFVGFKIRKITSLTMELQKLVNRDRLTNIATRDFFFATMDQTPDSYGVSLMIDIDNFKRVNDTHGHIAGDNVIRHVADTLRSECRPQDLVCRFGGEEFVVFLYEADIFAGEKIAERIRNSIASKAAVTDEDIQINVTVSIGGSLKARTDDIANTIKAADNALYIAKDLGRNRSVFDWMARTQTDAGSKAA